MSDAIEGEVEDGDGQSLRIMSSDAIQALTRAEVDTQIATAKQWPRDLARFRTDTMTMATLDEETAQACFYTLSRSSRDGGSNKIQGPSIRMAEIAMCNWGNLRVASRIVAIEDTMVVAQATCHDLQTNNAVQAEARRGIMTSGKKGQKPRRYGTDMIIVTCQAAASIALRNAIMMVIPRAELRPVYLKCRQIAAGDAATLGKRREAALLWFESKGAPVAKVLEWLGIKDVKDFTLDHIADLQGLRTAILDNAATIEGTFGGGSAPQGPETLEERLAARKAAAADKAPKGSKNPAEPAKEPSSKPKLTAQQAIEAMLTADRAQADLIYNQLCGPDSTGTQEDRDAVTAAWKGRCEQLDKAAAKG